MLVAMKKKKLYNTSGKKRNKEQILSRFPVRNLSVALVVDETRVRLAVTGSCLQPPLKIKGAVAPF